MLQGQREAALKIPLYLLHRATLKGLHTGVPRVFPEQVIEDPPHGDPEEHPGEQPGEQRHEQPAPEAEGASPERVAVEAEKGGEIEKQAINPTSAWAEGTYLT